MRIKKFRIANHKSYLDSGELTFEPGINVIVGKNNAGKTALLQALTMTYVPIPHRSLAVKPLKSSVLNSDSRYWVEFALSGKSLENECLTVLPFSYPVPFFGVAEAQIVKELEKLFSSPEVTFKYVGFGSSHSAMTIVKNGGEPAMVGLPRVSSNNNTYYRQFKIHRGSNSTNFQVDLQSQFESNNAEDFGMKLGNRFLTKIYKFDAERFKIGTCTIGGSTTLNPNAQNLPEVLHLMQSRSRKMFDQYNEYVKQIFGHIARISTAPINDRQVKIFVHMDPEERDDLSFDLEECGTGLSQVLAILYVALFEQEERVLIIDEPNTFLHPGAVKALMGILGNFNQHQYIISTHSTEIFKVSNVNSLKLIYWENSQSKVQEFSRDKIEETKKCLYELGIEMSDILAPDNLVWTEGATEAECFPRILKKFSEIAPYKTSFVPVKNTGDFDGKRANMVCDIYFKMSGSSLPLPSNTNIIFDSESKTLTEKVDLARKGNGKVHFLPRRMFENYLIHSKALSKLINSYPNNGNKTDAVDIEKWLKSNGSKFCESKDFNFTDETLEAVKGGQLISQLITDLTASTQKYDKVRDGIWLVDWILENDPSFLKPIYSFLEQFAK